jgi:S1-C subfamily serine protease
LLEPSRETAQAFGLEDSRGALAVQVFLGSPADKGGIRPGDFITHVNGRETRGTQQLQLLVGDLIAGENATFTIIRDKQKRDIQVRIEERTEAVSSDNKNLWPGVVVLPITEQAVQRMRFDNNAKGLYVEQVISGSPADIIGLRQGDRVTSINGENVNDILAFYKVLREKTANELWFGIIRSDASLETSRFKR